MAAVRRVVVGVHGSLGSLQALRYAAEEARERNVPLVPVIAWIPPGGDLAERSHPSPYLRRVWREAAREHLWSAFDAGLAACPPTCGWSRTSNVARLARFSWTSPRSRAICSSSGPGGGR